ncbi:ABC-type dipeptide/oligopeptide/nickel transport system ATPase subunit [Sedimentibacter acidaminivorans]|uniref:ABC-type dipeptide/oligopeptide/nickel transport system ATPase subunit n=1 Tax=Sedimentibacter acidaminivorans TaxID=913099 RepID=A0ABS4GF48_9FIRM|nr:dipeptide/oligopeptide/nickel ABC transporter ATP-binding protein [Sedimentibacter acidaminivorans]MBP1926267.1 ABC-type dipeptide/oligopeptide/nickel transport system ATPase subunit [Sedimentibacter acidaminivorans]
MLQIIDINKSYGSKKVLNNINIDFKPGESTAIVGESGSGKTTLAKIIIGLEKQNSGEILLNNKILQSINKRYFETCAKIQYIFQDPYSALEKNFTVLQTLNETVTICKRNNYDYMSIEDCIINVDKNLLNYLDQKVDILSGGQKQKLCIARSLITKPKIIIADECTSMLDKKNSEEIFNLLNKIKQEKNIILISILHEVDFYSEYWDKIAIFKDGNLLEYSEFKNFYNNAKNIYSKELIEAFKFFKYKGDQYE